MLSLVLLCVALASAQTCQDIKGCTECTAKPNCGYCWSSQICLSTDGNNTSRPTGDTCLSYAWFTSDGPKCPDAPDGCAAAQGCQDCVRSQACTFCVGSKTCVPIDMPNGGSSKCMNGGLVGHVEHDCDACRTHASCVDCQADQRKCFWCPHEQMCLAQGSTDKCGGVQSLPGNCHNCAAYADSCTSCLQQPDCAFCGGTCILKKDCAGGGTKTCGEACAIAGTCEGCIKFQDCHWDGSSCISRPPGGLQQHSCPPPSGFDGASFVGGMFLVIGLALIAGVIYLVVRWHKRRNDHSNLVVQ